MICECGHDEVDHGKREIIIERPAILTICWLCRYEKETAVSSVHDFKLDNLRYLEELSK